MAIGCTINTADLSRQLNLLWRDGLHAASATVQLWSKRTVKKLAWKTNLCRINHRHKGRLRAGWYPAASLLHAGGVYSGTYRNHGEGFCFDFSGDPQNPRVIMGNTVKFWPHVADLLPRLEEGMAELTARAKAEMEGDFSRFAGQNFVRGAAR